MKKFSWILALIAALAMVFVGCGGGSDGPIEGPKEFTLILGHNFQYSHGYQTGTSGDAHIDLHKYFKGKVSEGDEFTISFKVKASRDLEDQLAFGFVDPTDSSYWLKLTESIAIGPEGDERDDDAVGAPTAPSGGWLKANEEKTIDLTLTAIATANSDSDAANKLYFQSSGTCTKENCATTCLWAVKADLAEGAGGKLGPITLSFTDFTLKRVGDDPEPDVIEDLKLSTNTAFQALADTVTGGPAIFATLPGLANAGDGTGQATWKIVKVANKNAINLVAEANWVGMKIQDSHYKFVVGDQIKMTVIVNSATQTGTDPLGLVLKTGDWDPIGGNAVAVTGGTGGATVTAVTVPMAFTLDATDIANILKNTDKGPITFGVANAVADFDLTITEVEVIKKK